MPSIFRTQMILVSLVGMAVIQGKTFHGNNNITAKCWRSSTVL